MHPGGIVHYGLTNSILQDLEKIHGRVFGPKRCIPTANGLSTILAKIQGLILLQVVGLEKE
jgi:hypothetical protein